jgi:hypothetical protein
LNVGQEAERDMVDFVTPVEEYGAPTGPTRVISRSSVPFISSRVMFVGIAGNRDNAVKTVGPDIANAVTIEDAGKAGAGIQWLRLSRPRGDKFSLQGKDARGAVVISVEVSVIELPRASGSPKDFNIEPGDPNRPNIITLRAYAPADDADYIDTRMTGIGYSIYLGGFQVHCTGMDMPIDVPNAVLDINLIKAQAIDAKVYDTLAQAKEAIRVAPPLKDRSVTPIAYYRGAGGAVIAPTVFSPATTPRILATYFEARRLLAEAVQEELAGIAISLVGGTILRTILPRFFRMTPEEEPKPLRTTAPPLPSAKIRPVNDTVDVGGTGNIKNATNLNPVKPGSGGQESGIPNHVKGTMEEMDTFFEPGSVKTMYSQRLRYGDVDWPKATQAAAKVMPPGGKVSMNVWTQTDQEVAALKDAFQRAGFKNVRIIGDGSGTMVEAVR